MAMLWSWINHKEVVEAKERHMMQAPGEANRQVPNDTTDSTVDRGPLKLAKIHAGFDDPFVAATFFGALQQTVGPDIRDLEVTLDIWLESLTEAQVRALENMQRMCWSMSASFKEQSD